MSLGWQQDELYFYTVSDYLVISQKNEVRTHLVCILAVYNNGEISI